MSLQSLLSLSESALHDFQASSYPCGHRVLPARHSLFLSAGDVAPESNVECPNSQSLRTLCASSGSSHVQPPRSWSRQRVRGMASAVRSSFASSDDMFPGPTPNNHGGGDPPDDSLCRDCRKPQPVASQPCKTAGDRKAKLNEAKSREEAKRWDQQVDLFKSSLGVGFMAAIIYRVRKYLLAPKLRNRHGEEVDSDEGGETLV
ncbi:unnamed protein product [Amoebophrya sp. A120]|nr:unnamed protein product [Amoebophrya sp. A120]|eukprot:GSA120T00007811001.1